jgi:hypothetical protein
MFYGARHDAILLTGLKTKGLDMKRIIIRIGALVIGFATAFSATAYAAPVGPYIGAGAGYGLIFSKGTLLFDTNNGSSTQNYRSRGGLAGRGFLGFTFSSNIGIEAGYAYYPQSKYQANLDGLTAKTLYNSHAWDLVFKGYITVKQWNVYGLLGAAYVIQSTYYSNGGVPFNTSSLPAPPEGSSHIRKARGKYGAGFSYDFCNRFTAGLEYSRIPSPTSYHKVVLPIELYTANISYNFG